MERPHAADDFAAIRARMEELRRESERSARKQNDELIDASAHRPVEGRKPAFVVRGRTE
jgi:hypothetical protein